MGQRFSKAREAKSEPLTALTSGRKETPTGNIKFWASLKKVANTGFLWDVFHEFFQIQATPTIEILLSPKPRTSTEETP